MIGFIFLWFFVATIVYFIWNRYHAEHFPRYITFTTSIAWFLAFNIVVLLPIDVGSTIMVRSGFDPTMDYDTRMAMWKLVYWTSFVLNWLVMGVQEVNHFMLDLPCLLPFFFLKWKKKKE